MALSDHVFTGERLFEHGYVPLEEDCHEISLVLHQVDSYVAHTGHVFFGSSGHGVVKLKPESFAAFLVAFEKFLDRQK